MVGDDGMKNIKLGPEDMDRSIEELATFSAIGPDGVPRQRC
jgi:hypothetical protein